MFASCKYFCDNGLVSYQCILCQFNPVEQNLCQYIKSDTRETPFEIFPKIKLLYIIALKQRCNNVNLTSGACCFVICFVGSEYIFAQAIKGEWLFEQVQMIIFSR